MRLSDIDYVKIEINIYKYIKNSGNRVIGENWLLVVYNQLDVCLIFG